MAFRGLIFLNARGGGGDELVPALRCQFPTRVAVTPLLPMGSVRWRDAADRIGERMYPTKVVGPRQTPGVERLLNGWSV